MACIGVRLLLDRSGFMACGRRQDNFLVAVCYVGDAGANFSHVTSVLSEQCKAELSVKRT
jgi:hypothetical protein